MTAHVRAARRLLLAIAAIAGHGRAALDWLGAEALALALTIDARNVAPEPERTELAHAPPVPLSHLYRAAANELRALALLGGKAQPADRRVAVASLLACAEADPDTAEWLGAVAQMLPGVACDTSLWADELGRMAALAERPDPRRHAHAPPVAAGGDHGLGALVAEVADALDGCGWQIVAADLRAHLTWEAIHVPAMHDLRAARPDLAARVECVRKAMPAPERHPLPVAPGVLTSELRCDHPLPSRVFLADGDKIAGDGCTRCGCMWGADDSTATWEQMANAPTVPRASFAAARDAMRSRRAPSGGAS